MSEPTKAAKDWQWWLRSPSVGKATVPECIHEAQAYIAELEALVDRDWHERDTWLLQRNNAVERAERAEAELEKLRHDRAEILDSAWNTANERAKQANAAIAELEADLAHAIEARDKSEAWAIAECKARGEAHAEVVKLRKMLELAYGNWADARSYEAWLADLARRVEETEPPTCPECHVCDVLGTGTKHLMSCSQREERHD